MPIPQVLTLPASAVESVPSASSGMINDTTAPTTVGDDGGNVLEGTVESGFMGCAEGIGAYSSSAALRVGGMISKLDPEVFFAGVGASCSWGAGWGIGTYLLISQDEPGIVANDAREGIE